MPSKIARSQEKNPLQSLVGVGPQLAEKLGRIGIHKPEDLLFHLPLRYQDRTRVTALSDLQAGASAVVIGRIDACEVRFGKRRTLLVGISDDNASILLRFFHFSRNQQASFRSGAWIHCYGEIRRGLHSLEMIHPEYRIFSVETEPNLERTMTPVYPTTDGIGPTVIRKLVAQSLEIHTGKLKDILPAPILNKFGLMDLEKALLMVHRPTSDINIEALMSGVHPCQQRLALEEMLAHHLALKQIKQNRVQEQAPAMSIVGNSWGKLKASLDYNLTNAQIRVIDELFSDISSNHPTLRLVQGDVGSGKTIVAAAAALRAIDNGYQVALMAPTELLAEQHRRTFDEWFSSLGIESTWLTGKLPAQERRSALESISTGSAKMVVGTHALFQKQVEFHSLGLMIIDEQHRFGVEQRLSLRSKSTADNSVLPAQLPHQIIMSATPIPRSLAMILYADLDVSNIDEMPPGRKSVQTVVIPDNRREEVATRILSICKAGQQAYWVCPLIDESEKLQAQAATQTAELLSRQLSEINVTLIHGRLKSAEKDAIMEKFNHGEIDLLVSTTVIEVGVNVPNASLMVIENAERLGLAQLHQLRGRVGRGSDQASCVLIYQSPLGNLAKDRLSIMRETNDGFLISQKDLEHRGPGELMGTRQTGLQQMKIADLARDRGLIPKIEQISQHLQNDYPDLIQPIISRWMSESTRYAKV